ncbi:MAG: hemerythrin family protein [Deltaproteobacteria bacterium]|nr:hemerythrin family protein [Deltaproteobacteria bacterium]
MLQWEPSMETKVSEIDRQHKDLVKRVNDLIEAMRAGKGRQLVGDVLVFLGKYAVQHFGTEEALMQKHRYPNYEAHKGIHEAFKKDFGKLAQEFQEGSQNLSLTIAVQQRVLDWLKRHILETDQELGRFLKTCGVN